jgi:hypothetical protein
MSHDLEEFLEESGLRSGNRRMALYPGAFAPDAATSDAGADVAFVRGAGLPRRRSRRQRRRRRALGRAGPRSPRAWRCDEVAPSRPRPHARHLVRIGRDPRDEHAAVWTAAQPAGEPRVPAHRTSEKTAPGAPWLVIALCIGSVAAMVIMTLK